MAWLCITFAFYLQTAELVLQMGIAHCQKKHLSLLTGKSQTLPAQWQSDALILAGDDPKGANKNPPPGENLSRTERLDLPPPLR